LSVLIAEENPISRRFLQQTLEKWGYEVVVAENGDAAWRSLEGRDAPPLAILADALPGLSGIEVCRRVRRKSSTTPAYLILLTGEGGVDDIVTGLCAGADDCLAKPFELTELRARLQVGQRVVKAHRHLTDRIEQLGAALSSARPLQGLVPICAWCKKIRDDSNLWEHLETYISRHSEAEFTHAVCPDCSDRVTDPVSLVAGD